jgi:hypothetical protein
MGLVKGRSTVQYRLCEHLLCTVFFGIHNFDIEKEDLEADEIISYLYPYLGGHKFLGRSRFETLIFNMCVICPDVSLFWTAVLAVLYS